MTQVVSLTFYRFDSVMARTWAFVMMGLARGPLARIPGICFWKLCGSGGGEGFDVTPNINVFALLATWPDLETAQSAHRDAKILQRYRTKAVEAWTVYLTTDTVRGVWSGQEPFTPSPSTRDGPLGVLTRATIKPRTLARFWGRVPNISAVIGQDPNVLFKIGIGDRPWFQQVTFSLWRNADDMANFARRGPHAAAIKKVRDEGWFSEELYARFTLVAEDGQWNGGSPLQQDAT